MSYSINISGHKATESEKESRAFEQSVRDQAVEFVRSLEGVTGASGTFGVSGSVDLKAEAEAE